MELEIYVLETEGFAKGFALPPPSQKCFVGIRYRINKYIMAICFLDMVQRLSGHGPKVDMGIIC